MIINYEKFEKDEVNKLFNEKEYNVVYINYEKENGIEVVENQKDAIANLKNNKLDDFYKLYLFNEDMMITVYKFDENDFRYMKVEKSDFNENVIEKEIYLENKDYLKSKKLKVKIGKKVIEKEEFSIIQYVGFVSNVGGEE